METLSKPINTMTQVSHQLKVSFLQPVAGIWGRGQSAASSCGAAHTLTFLIHSLTQAWVQNPLLPEEKFLLSIFCFSDI